jgi:general secretion pathway protein G
MKAHVRQSGFTLVEILIVVIILGILAAIIIPQFTDASTAAKDSSMNSNLQTLQSQCELYKVQHNDVYPWDVNDDGTYDGDDALATQLTTKTDAAGVAGGPYGAYMQNVAANPFSGNVDTVIFVAVANDAAVAAARTESGTDWVINMETGALHSGTSLHIENGGDAAAEEN